MHPIEYARKYGLAPIEAAKQLSVSENFFRRLLLKTKSSRNPGKQTCRIAQLLDFIRSNGLTPPEHDSLGGN